MNNHGILSEEERVRIKEHFSRGLNRLKRAMEGIPDRVPVYAQLHEYALKISGLPGERFYKDAKILTESTLKTSFALGLDNPNITYDCYNIEVEALGIHVEYFPKSSPESFGVLLQRQKDLTRLKQINPYRDGRMPFILEMIDHYRQIIGQPPNVYITAPFTLAVKLRGFENFLIDLVTDETFAKDVLDYIIYEILCPYIKAIRAVMGDHQSLIIAADAIASPPNLSPEMVEHYALNPIIKLRKACGEEIILLNWWGESYLINPEDLLRLKLKASPHVIAGQDPDVEKLGPKLYKKFSMGNGVTLILGFSASLLTLGDPDVIRTCVERYVRIGKEGGRFIFYFCNVGFETPDVNVKTAVEAVKKYGDYSSEVL